MSSFRQPASSLDLRRILASVAIVVASAASIATSPIRSERAYPSWDIHSLGARRVGCAIVEVWISKSGKQGVGASVAMHRAASGPCRVQFVSAELDAGGSVPAHALPAASDLTEAETVFYIPFLFDNQAAWNRGVREGSLSVALDVTGAGTEQLRFRMREQRPGPHQVPERPPSSLPLPPHSDAGLVIADPNAPLGLPSDAGSAESSP